MHHLEAKVGGTFKMSFTNFTTGASHSFGGEYLELTPHERIRYTDKFDDPNLPGEIQTTIDLKKVDCGTELSIVQEGVLPVLFHPRPGISGWRESSFSWRSSLRLKFRTSGMSSAQTVNDTQKVRLELANFENFLRVGKIEFDRYATQSPPEPDIIAWREISSLESRSPTSIAKMKSEKRVKKIRHWKQL